MNSRSKILNTISGNQPAYLPLPSFSWNEDARPVTEYFMNTLKGIGGKVFIIDDPESIREHVLETHGDGKRIVNQFSLLDWKNFDNVKYEPAGSLERIEVAIIEGDMGVAENGAIWVDGNSLGHRALPFICQHLVIVLSESKIVSTLHQAYSKINVRESGFGTFIAGPSKTADIEQSLVIGAHGARSMTAFVMRGK